MLTTQMLNHDLPIRGNIPRQIKGLSNWSLYVKSKLPGRLHQFIKSDADKSVYTFLPPTEESTNLKITGFLLLF